ncbi:hypothetical protein [Zooshikella sp. RANM57]|uniref:hypothetical protein n=1 Tax=Zooshikella sp. RANM57 TaxID=3425863 RepID=UPI003D6E43FA
MNKANFYNCSVLEAYYNACDKISFSQINEKYPKQYKIGISLTILMAIAALLIFVLYKYFGLDEELTNNILLRLTAITILNFSYFGAFIHYLNNCNYKRLSNVSTLRFVPISERELYLKFYYFFHELKEKNASNDLILSALADVTDLNDKSNTLLELSIKLYLPCLVASVGLFATLSFNMFKNNYSVMISIFVMIISVGCSFYFVFNPKLNVKRRLEIKILLQRYCRELGIVNK